MATSACSHYLVDYNITTGEVSELCRFYRGNFHAMKKKGRRAELRKAAKHFREMCSESYQPSWVKRLLPERKRKVP